MDGFPNEFMVNRTIWNMVSRRGKLVAIASKYTVESFGRNDFIVSADSSVTLEEFTQLQQGIADAMIKRNERNAAARGRSDAMRSIGMTKTRYGWE